jgi:hypothetical protein
MKSFLKLTGIAGLAGISHALLAADVTTTYTTYATNTRAPLHYSASSSIATSSSNAVMLALNAQALVLKEMMQEHQKRAADLTQKGQGEKAKWETDLVSELQEKIARNSDLVSQPRAGVNDPKAAAGEVDDQLIFVSAVEARLQQLRQDLSAALEDVRVLSTQIGTNKVQEDIASMSLVLGENQKLVKELQREQLDLELRKLEFRAIWKMMPK